VAKSEPNDDNRSPLAFDPPAADQSDASEVEAEQPAEGSAEGGATAEDAAEPTVEVVLDPDFEADGDVYVQIAELPADLADDDDRFKVPTKPQEVPASVAAALADSAAVKVVPE
jgi:hypothetical protein